MSKRMTAAVWVKGMAEMLAAEGMDVRALLAAAGIDPAALEAPGARLQTEKISRAVGARRRTIGQSGDRARAAPRGAARKLRRGRLHHDVMRRPARCLRAADTLHAHPQRRVDDDDEPRARRMAASTFVLFGGDRPVPRQRVEFILVTVIGFCRWISRARGLSAARPNCRIPRRRIPRPTAPPFAARYRSTRRAPACCSPAPTMTAPLPTSNPLLAELHDRFAGEYLRQFDHAQTSYRVREVIVRRLPDGGPRRDEVASELHMSERTLQRRLEEEATSFVPVARRHAARARRAVSRPAPPVALAQAAYLLGFADQSSFFRACKRWFDLSPGQYRSQLLRHSSF